MQKLLPGLLDLYLRRTGYSSQQTGERISQQRPDNLFAPVTGDYAAHGSFDKLAADRSTEPWLGTHRAASIGAAFLVIGIALAGMRRLFHE
jgi:hypothetical protein